MLNFSREGYDGTLFSDFYIQKSSGSGPGWFIFGRNTEKYGVDNKGKGNYIKLCGYRIKKKARNYNGIVRCGWKTKKEAEAILAEHLKNYPQLAN